MVGSSVINSVENGVKMMNEEENRMENLKIFQNEEFGEIRTVEIDRKPYFVGSDVAKALGYAIPHKAVQTHCKGVLKWNIPTNSGNQDVLTIPEGDIYRLIIKSKLPAAERFEKWVFDEVLPSIRKNGGYIAGQETLSDDELLAKAVMVAQRKIAEREKVIKDQQETIDTQSQVIEQQSNQLQIQKPFVQAALKLQNTNNTISMEQAAKALTEDGIRIGRNTLFSLLRENGILMKNNSPYQKYMDVRLFEVKIVFKENRYGSRAVSVTRVTGKGLIFLNKKLREWFGMEELNVEI